MLKRRRQKTSTQTRTRYDFGVVNVGGSVADWLAC